MEGRLSWGLAALAVALLVAAEAVSVASGSGVELGNEFFPWALALGFATTGVLIAVRQPRNAIGWIFLGAAVAVGLGALAGSYAEYWVDEGKGPEALGEDGRVVRGPLLDAVHPRPDHLPVAAVP